MDSLLQHIKDLNAKTQAWIDEAPTQRFSSFIHEDLELWKRDGITTIDEFQRYSLATTVYDLTKEIWGYRPNWQDLFASSVEHLKEELARLNCASETSLPFA